MAMVALRLGEDGIITVVDAKHCLQHLHEEKPDGVENEAVEQLAFADRIIVNKTDLVRELSEKPYMPWVSVLRMEVDRLSWSVRYWRIWQDSWDLFSSGHRNWACGTDSRDSEYQWRSTHDLHPEPCWHCCWEVAVGVSAVYLGTVTTVIDALKLAWRDRRCSFPRNSNVQVDEIIGLSFQT